MKQAHFSFMDPERIEVFVHKWVPDEGVELKAAIQIAHGMAETSARYERLAEQLTKEGYVVYANDHRGHGKTAGCLENVGYTGEDGYNWMVKNMHQLTDIISSENPALPLFLFGHSMGSFLSQQYIAMYGEGIGGVILSGTNSKAGPEVSLGILLAKYQVKKLGAKTPSHLLNKLSFGSYNNSFKPNRTEFDWLSRDPEEVDKYVKDPYCGTIFSTSFYHYFLEGFKKLHSKENLNNIPKDLPVFIFSGDKDPVGKSGKGPAKLAELYRSLGINDVSLKLYKDGRHEMLNETNRDEVVTDIIEWLNAHI